MSTEFAPPEKASAEELQTSVSQVAGHPIVSAMFKAVDVIPLLLNQQRQVIAFNPATLHNLGIDDANALVGMRPGEVFHCMTRKQAASGCGTSKNCQVCGIVNAILESQQTGRVAEHEGLLRVEREGHEQTLELMVRAAPLTIQGNAFTFVYLRDISDRKRRQVLERIFIHDLRNTITGLLGWTSHLHDELGKQAPEVTERILAVAERLNREVREQHALLQAESGEFQPAIGDTSPAEIVSQLETVFARNLFTEEKHFEIQKPLPDISLQTDADLLVRVLINMLKNAFEATPRGGKVSLACQTTDAGCRFSVQNPGEIPQEIANQVFRRSFSTKSETGRGLGTYSMKLFGERFLHGQVSFSTTPEEGTVFWITVPLKWESSDD